MNIAKFLKVLLQNTSGVCFGYNNQSRYFEKEMLQKSKENMLHYPISVDMKVYALQLKQKSTAHVSNRFL